MRGIRRKKLYRRKSLSKTKSPPPRQQKNWADTLAVSQIHLSRTVHWNALR